MVMSLGVREGATILVGCGSKVNTAARQPRDSAIWRTRRRMRRWPVCTPSKFPIVRADGPKPTGTWSRLRKTRKAPLILSSVLHGDFQTVVGQSDVRRQRALGLLVGEVMRNVCEERSPGRELLDGVD